MPRSRIALDAGRAATSIATQLKLVYCRASVGVRVGHNPSSAIASLGCRLCEEVPFVHTSRAAVCERIAAHKCRPYRCHWSWVLMLVPPLWVPPLGDILYRCRRLWVPPLRCHFSLVPLLGCLSGCRLICTVGGAWLPSLMTTRRAVEEAWRASWRPHVYVSTSLKRHPLDTIIDGPGDACIGVGQHQKVAGAWLFIVTGEFPRVFLSCGWAVGGTALTNLTQPQPRSSWVARQAAAAPGVAHAANQQPGHHNIANQGQSNAALAG